MNSYFIEAIETRKIKIEIKAETMIDALKEFEGDAEEIKKEKSEHWRYDVVSIEKL